MRALLAVLVVGACSFTPGVYQQGSSDAPDGVGSSGSSDADPCAGPDTDGDGVNDPCDACPQDATNDSDGDGVCDSADACPGSNDGMDSDGDAVPDGCDDWPCGPKPEGPPSVVSWITPQENVTLSNINVAGMGQLAVVPAGMSFTVSAGYSIIDCQCSGCIDQIEIGFHTIGKSACLYDNNPNGNSNCLVPTLGSQSRMVTAPNMPGVYELRFNRGNDNSCQNNGAWWANVPPGPGNTFALVCVR